MGIPFAGDPLIAAVGNSFHAPPYNNTEEYHLEHKGNHTDNFCANLGEL